MPSWLNKALVLGLSPAPEMDAWWAWPVRGPTGRALVRWDGFVHGRYGGAWADLMRAAMDWARGRCWVRLCVEDEEKGAWLKELGFVDGGRDESFVMGDRTVEAVRLVASV